MSGSGLVGELVAVSSELGAVMDREVAALEAGRIDEVRALQAEKTRLVRNYQTRLDALKADPALYVAVEPPIKEELLDSTRRLRAALSVNASALKAAQAANERLMRTIARAASEERGTAGTGYARPAARSAGALSLALDRQL
jgi:flagellar biosynthesis/type III secretory pathway chaperone